MNRKRVRLVFLFLFTFMVSLVGTRFYMTDKIDTRGEEYAKLEEELWRLKSENMMLRQSILEKTSYTYINDHATAEGFLPTQYVIIRQK